MVKAASVYSIKVASVGPIMGVKVAVALRVVAVAAMSTVPISWVVTSVKVLEPPETS